MFKFKGATEPVEQLPCVLVSVCIQSTAERHWRGIVNGSKAIVLFQGVSPVICEFDCQRLLRRKGDGFLDHIRHEKGVSQESFLRQLPKFSRVDWLIFVVNERTDT